MQTPAFVMRRWKGRVLYLLANLSWKNPLTPDECEREQKLPIQPSVGWPESEITTKCAFLVWVSWHRSDNVDIKELIGRDPADQGFEQEILWIDEGENWEYGWRELKERFKFNNNRFDCHCFAVYCKEQEICAKKGSGCGGTTCGSRARQKPSRRNP